MKETDKDQRAHSRIPSSFTVVVTKLEYPFDGSGVSATLKDVADGGISFISSESYASQTLVSLKVDMKGWRRYAKSVRAIVDDTIAIAPLTAVAEVVWSKGLFEGQGYEIGAKFKNIDKDDYSAFQKYLEYIRSSNK